jgi:hypothetical protein
MVGVFVMVLPVAVLFSAVLLAVALFAKTTKEAQTYVSPMAIVIVLPAMVGMLPGMELDAKLALVPDPQPHACLQADAFGRVALAVPRVDLRFDRGLCLRRACRRGGAVQTRIGVVSLIEGMAGPRGDMLVLPR